MSAEKKWLASDGKTELRPGMLVLVRNDEEENWWVNVLSHCNMMFTNSCSYCCIDGEAYLYCFPLAGNASLAGTDAPILEPCQDAPQPDKPLEWGERVRVWKENGEKKEGIFIERPYGRGYDVILQGRKTITHWPHCERI